MTDTLSLRIGAEVEHGANGVGIVVFAKEGFPKAKVRFGALTENVAVSELRVRKAPRVVVSDELVLRVLESMEASEWYVPGTPLREGPWRDKGGYPDAEIELIYRVSKSPANAIRLARLLQRTHDAIDFVWRWRAKAGFPSRSNDAIKRQVASVEARLGTKAIGTGDHLVDELMRVVGLA